jgi:hypothetical protein
MTYALLIKKLERSGGKYLTREELKALSKELGLGYYPVINYLGTNKYLLRVMRGVFYVKSIEERKLGRLDVSYLEAIKEALALKKVGNWYFGLETAASLGNLTHEYFTTTFVISDAIGRPKPFEILGHKVKFIKVSKKLFGFGIVKGKLNYSEPEKTVLDMIYLSRYNGLAESEVEGRVSDVLEHCSKDKLESYAGKYPSSVKKFLEKIG